MSLVCLIFAGCDDPGDSKDSGPLFDVGIYAGEGAFVESVKACFAVVRFSGLTCDTLRSAELQAKSISRFAAIIFPAGDAHYYSDITGPVGRGNIRNFVAEGGGYIGFGAGGAFAAADTGTWPGLGILPGTTRYPSERIAPNPYYGIVEITRGATPGFVAKGIRYQTLYYGGPEFFPLNSRDLSVDYNYFSTGSAAAIGGEYGFGQFWVAGFQPEFEEGNGRDGTTFGDDLNDIDSEWELIQSALDFCITYENRL